MPTRFDLIIAADYPNRTADFCLLDDHGTQLAFRRTDFKTVSTSQLRGMFDLRDYLRLFVEEGNETAAVAEIGICIAEKILGQDIFEILWRPESQRTLRVQLPGATDAENYLAAALARVPWEIARPAAGQKTLSERNLLIRVVHDMHAPTSQPVELAADEPLRVLFVFAEARGSRPLGARQERLELLRLFEREIYPQRRVVAHFLTHGVTRERLKSQIRDNGGYHVVHWSGHGHLNLLELAKAGGASDRISGRQLLDLFLDAGGFLPRLVFLSACHSGDILSMRSWKDFLAMAEGKDPESRAAVIREFNITEQPGFTGTAHALMQGGVPSVVAMRYAVGDDYARELAVEFYRGLLAHAQPKNVVAALTLARQSMLDRTRHDLARFVVCDHATPVLYGAEQPGLTLAMGRSPGLNPRNPRLHQITELTTAGHEHFVGRTWELAGLGADFIGSGASSEAKPVAAITGLGGMGKTALVAEALALWDTHFEWVLLYQGKPNALGFEAMLRDFDLKLRAELRHYYKHVTAWPADAIYREATSDFTGPERQDRLLRNAIRAMKDEAILLVLDNFETTLKPQAEGTSAASTCSDPAWDHFLTSLIQELTGSSSRVLIGCRQPLAAIADGGGYSVQLGPLPPWEAALYLRAHPALSKMAFGADPGEKALAIRLLNASRFHPLLMDRLARLAADAKLRPRLVQALDTLEQTKDFAQLPALFATRPGDAKELAYLNEALATSLDQLIRDASSDARRLLWMIAVANEPVELKLLAGVWSGDNPRRQWLRQIKQKLDALPELPEELQQWLKGMPPEMRDEVAAVPPKPPAQPEIAPLLRHLVSVGLATEEHTGSEDAQRHLTCHELVRERIRGWMEDHLHDRHELTENAIRLQYAAWLHEIFGALLDQHMTHALEAGSRALVYCVQAGDWFRLCDIASGVVARTHDARLLEDLLPHLQSAAEVAPNGRVHWKCLAALADALANSGHPDASLRFFNQAASEARSAARTGDGDAESIWADIAAISGNCANANRLLGNLTLARTQHLKSAIAEKKARAPAVAALMSEMEVLRIDILQGRINETVPLLNKRLAKIEGWWKQHTSGRRVPEAPDPEVLSRALANALDVATEAASVQQDWTSALRYKDAILRLTQERKAGAHEIAIERLQRANALIRLGRLNEAKSELEDCLVLFTNSPVDRAKALSGLAVVFDAQGDISLAISLERQALAICDASNAPIVCSASHQNISNYLEKSGRPADIAESTHHQLAALVYDLVTRMHMNVAYMLANYAIRMQRAQVAGTELAVPRVAELLTNPTFSTLQRWLRQRQVNVDELQTAMDQILEQARQAAFRQK